MRLNADPLPLHFEGVGQNRRNKRPVCGILHTEGERVTSEQSDRIERDTEAWRVRMSCECDAAGLNILQREVVMGMLVDGDRPADVVRMLKRSSFRIGNRSVRVTRVSEVQALYVVAVEKLRGLPGFNEAAAQFGKDLMICVGNHTQVDDREADVCGVTPDRSSDRFQGAPMIDAAAISRAQNTLDKVRLWVERRRPCLYPTDASLSTT